MVRDGEVLISTRDSRETEIPGVKMTPLGQVTMRLCKYDVISDVCVSGSSYYSHLKCRSTFILQYLYNKHVAVAFFFFLIIIIVVPVLVILLFVLFSFLLILLLLLLLKIQVHGRLSKKEGSKPVYADK